MKAAIGRDKKKFELRYATKPQSGFGLSGVVVVLTEEGRKVAYVKFSEDFVHAVGRVLPYGTGEETPSYLKVIHMRGRDSWRIFVCYLDGSKTVFLWETHEKPSWLRYTRR